MTCMYLIINYINKKYFHTTKHMIARRLLLEAVPVELRDKHVVNSGLAGK